MFITREDPNMVLKGSRDPLSLVPIRFALGRHVISNLNTQSNSVRGFMTLILGRYLAEFFIEKRMAEERSAVDIFLRFEQLVAYVRHVGHHVDSDIRGIERVRANSRRRPHKIPIHTDKEGRILSDQKLYGLWGLFSVPARTSNLIDQRLVGVTEQTKSFIETNYMPVLEPTLKSLEKFLIKGGEWNSKKKDQLFSQLLRITSEDFTEKERQFYNEYLCDAKHVQLNPISHQHLFKELLLKWVEYSDPLGRETFELLRNKATSTLTDNDLARRLDQILRMEAVLSISAAVFNYLISRDRTSLDEIAKYLSDRWGASVPGIEPEKNNDLLNEVKAVYTDSNDVRDFFDQCQQSLSSGRYSDLIDSLIRWNTFVSLRRGGAPWLSLGSKRRLDVRYRGVQSTIPSAEELPGLWHNGYFVTSLHSIAHQLR